MRDAVSNTERWKGRRTPTQDPSTNKCEMRVPQRHDWADLKAIFEARDVWHVCINMPPQVSHFTHKTM